MRKPTHPAVHCWIGCCACACSRSPAARPRKPAIPTSWSARYAYSAAIRWGDFEGAWHAGRPEYRKEHPLSDLELERYKQIQIAGYRDLATQTLPDGDVVRDIEIGVVNRHTLAERSPRYTERWRFDPEDKQWWLVVRPAGSLAGLSRPAFACGRRGGRQSRPARQPPTANPVNFEELLAFASRHILYCRSPWPASPLALVYTEIARLFRGYKALRPAELTALINRENALVVDLSASNDFEKGHIPGSSNVALEPVRPREQAAGQRQGAAGGGGLPQRPGLGRRRPSA